MPSDPSAVAARRLVVRVDASEELGTGHVMRSLAVADELAGRGFRSTFLMRPAAGDLRDVVESHGHAVLAAEEAWPAAGGAGRAGRADWALVDHYGLDARWEREARRGAVRVAAFDDLADRPHAADVLVDANLDATEAKYAGRVTSRTELLLGPRFAPLRPGFLEARASVRPVQATVTRVVVSMGGSDPANATELAIAAARRALPEARIDVIVGPAFGRRIVAGDRGVHLHRSPARLTAILAAADLAVGAGGTSALERACLGLPSLVLQIADNQVAVAEALGRHGVAEDLGRVTALAPEALARSIQALAADPARRRAMRDAGRQLVDGRGLVRIANRLDGVRLRKATWADRLRLLAWANDAETRRNSLSVEPIRLEDHLAWLRRTLDDPDTDLVVAANGLGPVGVVRFAPGWRGRPEVSVTIDPQHRGTIGSLVLRTALARWDRRHPGAGLVARIRPANVASARAFTRAGFAAVDEDRETIVYARPPAARRPGPGREEETES